VGAVLTKATKGGHNDEPQIHNRQDRRAAGRFHQASRTLSNALHLPRDLAAQFEAELYLARLFGDGAGIRPQPTP
jgi:hypothetical protein